MTPFRPFLVAPLVLVAIMLGGVRAQAQDNPLEFTTDFPRIGGEIGLSSVWQDGVYSSLCGRFDEGAGINPVIALAYDYPLTSFIRFEALLGYQGYSVTSTYNSRELEVVNVRKSGTADSFVLARVNVDFENVGSLSMAAVFLAPSVKFYLTRGLYLGGGASASLLLGGKTQYTKNILSKVVSVPDLGLAEVYYPESETPDPYSKVYDEQDLPNKAGIGLGVNAYIGAEIPLNRRLRIGPRVQYQLPLAPVVTDPELKLNAFTVLVGVRYDID